MISTSTRGSVIVKPMVGSLLRDHRPAGTHGISHIRTGDGAFALSRAGHGTDARWWVNWKWQRHRAIPYYVTRGAAWLEVVQPTRTRPWTPC